MIKRLSVAVILIAIGVIARLAAQQPAPPVPAQGVATFRSTTRLVVQTVTVKDKDGRNFDGSTSYRLTVSANAPVNQYWSATVYDRATHSLIRDMSRSGRGSQSQGLQKNADGSVDIYFGPKAPAGKDSNWVPTNAGGQFEVLFRFYGPEKPLFDKTWKLPDIEKVK